MSSWPSNISYQKEISTDTDTILFTFRNPEIAIDKSKRIKKPESVLSRGNLNDIECGTSSIQTKIVGGELAELDEFPWLGLLLYQNRDSDVLTSGCGSALISEQ